MRSKRASKRFRRIATRADRSDQTNQTRTAGADAEPSSPRGKWIAVRSSRDGNDEVYAIRANGSSQTNLSKKPADESNPAWWP